MVEVVTEMAIVLAETCLRCDHAVSNEAQGPHAGSVG